MPPEGVVHALRRIHRTLVPGGLLLDLHPIPPDAAAEAGGVVLARFDGSEFWATVRATEAGLDETVRAGLFAPEAELEFDVLDRFDTVEEALAKAESMRGYRVPPGSRRRVRAAAAPIDIRHRLLLRRLRGL